jgi:cytochrome P450
MEASGSPSDLVAAFALPVPARVICELMGVPFADHGFFEHACAQVINVDVSAEAAFEAMSAIAGSLVSLIRSKCEEPTDDVVSDLAKEVAEGRMSVEECVADCQIVLLGGYETTAKMIALGTCLLLQHPDALVRVREGGQQAVSGAVDELVRYLSIGHGGRRRVATADIEVTGGVIRAGDAVVFVDDVANRDPQAFEEPNRLDIGRSCRHHMAFGFGPHRCLGESLGRLELEIALPALLRRFPGLRLDRPLGELPFRSNQMFYGLDAMPVAW